MSKRRQETDCAAALESSYARWNEVFTNGGSDPFWTDGVNLELVRNQIISYKQQLEKQGNSLFGLPDIYYRELPPEVDPNYMARPDEIRENARKAMKIIDSDKNLKFVREQAPSLSEAQLKQFCIDAIINYAENLRRAIAADDLVIMRRYEHLDRYLDSFESAALKIRDSECTRRINDNLTVCTPQNDEGFEEESSETEQGEDDDITESADEPDEDFQLRLF
jgi:hypothetical protein